MNENLTSAYTRFVDLKSSSQFLDFLLNNISSCVLMLNKEMKLQAFNDPFKTLFENSNSGKVLYERCGEVIGCAFTVDEEKNCGETSHCDQCILRLTALKAFSSHKNIYNQILEREFYLTKGKKERRKFRFSAKPLYHETNYYLIVILDDITFVDDKTNNRYKCVSSEDAVS